jgi:hypothetical protein
MPIMREDGAVEAAGGFVESDRDFWCGACMQLADFCLAGFLAGLLSCERRADGDGRLRPGS